MIREYVGQFLHLKWNMTLNLSVLTFCVNVDNVPSLRISA